MSHSADVTPLGPGSLSWRYTGDWRNMLLIGRVGFLQLMLPELGAGVVQHSAFYTEPLQRVLRSLPPMAGMVYDGPAALETAQWIRDLHKPVKGADVRGRRYHALNPEVFFWAHATIHEHVLTTIDVFDHPLTGPEEQQLFEEMAQVWRMFGMSTRPVPASAEAFRRYFDQMCAERLEETPAAAALRTFVTEPAAMPQPWLPRWLWRPIAPSGLAVLRSLTIATLPPAVAAKLGLEATARDRRRLRAISALVRRGWPALPAGLRYMPRARAAFARVRAAHAQGSGPQVGVQEDRPVIGGAS
jgi:uncharacterized protein (DUF2236 family)